MALDEPKDTDVTFVVAGYAYIVDRDLLDRTQPLGIDCTPTGFRITSQAVPGHRSAGCGRR